MRKFVFATLIAMLFVAFSAKAQDYEVQPPREDKVVVGAIGGTVDVTALGGASYTIPIQVPEGIGGMQPSLSVVYNSQSGNGLLGWGWNLGGLSAITRVGTTLYHDGFVHGVCFSTNFNDRDGLDRFALDGQRLMVVNGLPDGTDGTEYRTEIDQMAKIVSYSCDTTFGPAYFKVWLSNGNIAYYGSKWHSRIGLQQRNDVCLWLLDSVVDRNGNYISYRYRRGGANYFLSDILYTGNSRSSVSPLYRVKFEYDARPDIETVFIGNNTLHFTKIIKRISLFNRYNANSDPLWQYDFAYTGGYGNNLYKKLETITFSKGGEKYKSTTINWEQDTPQYSWKKVRHTGDGDMDSRTVKFPGDFNGDGYDDMITFEKRHNDGEKTARVYLNGRDGSGIVVFNQIKKYTLDENITWIYVADFDGDGLDDFMFANRERRDAWYLRDIVTLDIYLTRRNASGGLDFVYHESPSRDYRLASSKRDALILGDFLGEGKTSFILEISKDDDKNMGMETDGMECDTSNQRADRSYYIRYDKDLQEFVEDRIKVNAVLGADAYYPADYDGDGKTEILYSYPQNGYTSTAIVKLFYGNGRYGFKEHYNGYPNNWFDCCPGDFNGDGHADALFHFQPSDPKGEWRVYLFKQNIFQWNYYCCSNIPTGLSSGYFSLDKLNSVSSYLKVGDFNGDGCSDIMYPDHTRNTVFLFGPMRDDSDVSPFAYKRKYNFSWFSNLELGLGKFAEHEGIQLFAKTAFQNEILMVNPISNRYNVHSIEDGMYNRIVFEYDYLMPTLSGDHADDFFTLDHSLTDVDRSIFSRPLAIKALKKTTASNSQAGMSLVENQYRYGNVMVHTKGHGILGFTDVTVESYVDSEFKGKTMRHFSTSELGDKCQIVLKETKAYGPLNNLTQHTSYGYSVCQSSRNIKVFMLLPNMETGMHYSPDGSHDFVKQTLTSNEYRTDISSATAYKNIVHCTKTYQCVNDTQLSESLTQDWSAYKFRSSVENEYTDQVPDWIVSRPKSVLTTAAGNASEGNEDVKTLTVYDYEHPNHPTLPSRVTTYPSGVRPDGSMSGTRDRLATCETFAYNTNGTVSEKTFKAIYDSTLPTVTTTFEYTPNGQFLEKVTNTKGYVSHYQYDTRGDGHLTGETDCNGLQTDYFRSPLGTLQLTTFPDQTKRKTEKMCLDSDEIIMPEKAEYKEVSEQLDVDGNVMAASCSYFDALGRCLRVVSQGLNGEPICTDTKYNRKGLVERVSDPYFFGTSEENIKWTIYEYDAYGRNICTKFPDNTSQDIVYDGLTVTTTNHPATDEAVPQTTSKTVNVAGWLAESTDSGQNTVNYAYYADGSLKHAQIGDDANTRVSMEYDNARNRTKLTDPDYGTVTSHYNAYGQLRSTVNPRNVTTRYQYDELGRVKHRDEVPRNGDMVSTVWTYCETGHQLGLLKSINYNDDQQIVNYSYDQLNRVSSIKEGYDGQTFTTVYQYEPNTGRLYETTYPTGYKLRRVYGPYGHLQKLTDANGNFLWQTWQMNANGQITRYMTGNYVSSTLTYDDDTHRLRHIQTQLMAKNFLQDLWYDYDDFGNLAARKDILRDLEETFTYDNLNRLETTILNGGQANRMAYDPYGRILSKQANGQLVFDNPAYDDGNKPHAIRSAQMYGNPFPTTQQDITYTMFDKVATISQSGNGPQMSLSYTYGHDRQRKRMVEKIGNYTLREKRYGDHCEFVTENRYSMSRTFLSGPMGVFAVVEHNGDNDEIHYVYKDNLGSWTTITDAGGFVEREQSFDAWGNLRNPETWSGDYNNTLMFDRGFTGHEHLYSFGLINMNGRCYDPVTSSFLSVDKYVSQPDNSQSFNRYAYCLNNPLRYTDPSGWQPIGGLKPNNPFHDNWSASFSHPAYEPRDFRNPYHLWNLAMNGNLYGPGFAGGVSSSGGGASMSDYQGTYGYHAAYQANSVHNYTFPSAKLQLIRNWQYSPSYRTNSDIRDAGITGLTVGVANYGNGYQKSYYTWTTSGKTYSTSALDYVGRSRMDYYSMTIQPLEWYGDIVENRECSMLKLNSTNYYRYDGHMLTSPLIHTMQGGQHVRVVMKNRNVLPVTLQLQDISAYYYDGWFKRKKFEGESYSFTIVPYQTLSRDFYHFGDFPYTWQFKLNTVISDAASVEVFFYSDWVEGMPSSRGRMYP